MLSVICPIYNEEKYISQCIDSILKQDYPKDNLEVLFVDGMSKDKTREMVNGYSQKYPFIKIFDNPQKIVPYAMNIGIKEAKGNIIVRLDAHCEYPDNYFTIVEKNLLSLENAENVGGICETLPCNNSSTAIGISVALSSSFGMGNSYFRVGANKVMKVDTVPFGCFHKELFRKIGFYDNDLVRNQDDELNGRIIKNKGCIYLLPSLRIKYYARDKISKVRKMFYQYGVFKPLVNKKLGSPATLRQFFPLAFFLGLIIGGILSCLNRWVFYLYVFVLFVYLIIGINIGFKSSKKYNNIGLIWLLPYIFLNVHLSYGCGYIIGIFKILSGKSFSAKENR